MRCTRCTCGVKHAAARLSTEGRPSRYAAHAGIKHDAPYRIGYTGIIIPIIGRTCRPRGGPAAPRPGPAPPTSPPSAPLASAAAAPPGGRARTRGPCGPMRESRRSGWRRCGWRGCGWRGCGWRRSGWRRCLASWRTRPDRAAAARAGRRYSARGTFWNLLEPSGTFWIMPRFFRPSIAIVPKQTRD
jgi:hypothetical protein